MNTDVKEKQLVERDDLDLLELVCQLHSRALRANTEEMHFTYLAARRELEKRLHVYAKAYAPVPELSYSDKLFERYVVDARNEFVKFIVKHDSHIEAEHGRITEEGIKLRTACEDILIAYDQIKEKLAAPVPGKEEIIQDMVERIEKIILSPNKESERNVFNKAKEIYGLFASTKQSNESVQQAAKEWREKNAKFVPDNQSEIMLEKSFLAGASFNSKDKSNQ